MGAQRSDVGPARRQQPWAALTLIALAELLALTVWFSASAVAPVLEARWHVSAFQGSLLTSAVQLGFVVGALVSALLALADHYNPRKLFALSASLGAVVNAGLIISPGFAVAVTLRLATGVTLAGVYPIAVKLLAQWFPSRRGMAIGVLVGALTLGSALPHLVAYLGAADAWQVVVLWSSALALLGAFAAVVLLRDAPQRPPPRPKLSLDTLRSVLKDRPVMLANAGYFGHMWELYAMWIWLPAFLLVDFERAHVPSAIAASTATAFVSIGMGGLIGAVVGGWLADRVGRTALTTGAMVLSSICALTIGLTLPVSPWLTVVLSMLWGIGVIADSAQFSVAVTELCRAGAVGTALTFQMAVGFLITLVSINLVPWLLPVLTWRWIFALLAVGPWLGIWSMLVLRKMPSARQMASGRR